MTHATFCELLPRWFVVSEGASFDVTQSDFEVENSAVSGAVPKRVAQFLTARNGARRALAELDYKPTPILIGKDRNPVWPQGTVGSISHADSYWGVAVALKCDARSVGIDVEVNCPLPDEIRSDILTPVEQRTIYNLNTTGLPVEWSRLIFSAKESAYKFWYPQLGGWIGFLDCDVEVDPDAQEFEARLTKDVSVSGRWMADDKHILTVAYV